MILTLWCGIYLLGICLSIIKMIDMLKYFRNDVRCDDREKFNNMPLAFNRMSLQKMPLHRGYLLIKCHFGWLENLCDTWCSQKISTSLGFDSPTSPPLHPPLFVISLGAATVIVALADHPCTCLGTGLCGAGEGDVAATASLRLLVLLVAGGPEPV